jgi:uncharacterized membrane protein
MASSEFEINNTSAVIEELEEEKETGRIEAFSDGVFAIAATLLILGIQVPTLPNCDPLADAGALLDSLIRQWPHYLAYFMGFSTIVIMWINHHGLFRLIRRSTHGLLLWNSLLLLVISVVPFPTALVADYLSPLDSDRARLALAIYSGWGIVIALAHNALWWYMSYHNRLINRTADPREVRAVTQSYFFGPILYLAGLIAAIWSAPLSLAVNLLLAVFFALPSRVQGTLAATVKRDTASNTQQETSSSSR